MDHIAIMNARRKLIDKIVQGEKTIESRRYQTKRAPRDRIQPWDMIYFKDAGKPVTAQANVSKVLQFEDLDKEKISEIANNYAKGIGMSNETISSRWSKKKYCILVFLEDPHYITPFQINKQWFGNAAARLCIDNIKSIRNNFF